MTEFDDTNDANDAASASDPAADEAVRSLLRDAVGERPPAGDPRDELAALRPRFERARRRREAGVAGSIAAAAAVALVVVLSIGGGGGGRTQQIDVAGSDGSLPTTSAPAPSTTDAPSTTSTTAAASPTTVVGTPTTVSAPAGGTTGGPGPTAAERPPTTPTTQSAPTTVPTTAPPAPVTQVEVSDGGTATIRWTPTSVTVVATAPAAGWALEEVKQESTTRVVVKFRRDGGGPGSSSATIDARVVNGALRVDS